MGDNRCVLHIEPFKFHQPTRMRRFFFACDPAGGKIIPLSQIKKKSLALLVTRLTPKILGDNFCSLHKTCYRSAGKT